jgi:hypothetical protein
MSMTKARPAPLAMYQRAAGRSGCASTALVAVVVMIVSEAIAPEASVIFTGLVEPKLNLKSELLWISQSSGEAAIRRHWSAAGPGWRNRVLVATGAVLLAVATGLVTYISSKRLNGPPPLRSVILPPPQVTLLTLGDNAGAPAISLDGSKLVFVGMTDGKQMLFLRHLDAGTTEPLPGTTNGKFPFWSPDGKSLGFFADEQIPVPILNRPREYRFRC